MTLYAERGSSDALNLLDQIKAPLTYEELAEIFRLDLGGHKLVEPIPKHGTVVAIERLESLSIAGNEIPISNVRVQDPYVAADEPGYDLMNCYIAEIEAAQVRMGIAPTLTARTQATSPDRYNQSTQLWVGGPNVQAVEKWRHLVPTALALDYLSNPEVGRVMTDRKGFPTDIRISPESALQMRFSDDAVAIRNRSVAMKAIFERFLKDHEGESVSWISLASGMGGPVLESALIAHDKHGVKVDMTLTDVDETALAFVSHNPLVDIVPGTVSTHRVNLFSNVLPRKLEQAGVQQNQFDVVENMGFKEYMPGPRAIAFTRQAYSLVKPGGILLSGNMIDQRPQLDYLLGIVDWPLINLRSEEQILEIYRQAGVLNNKWSNVGLFRVVDDITSAHIYDIVAVTKDESAPQH